MKLNMIKYGTVHPMTFVMDQYSENGNLYLGLVTHESGFPEPWQNLTVNLGVKCKENCAFIDTHNNGTEIIEWLMTHKLCRLTGRMETSGFCVYPEVEFNMKQLEKYIE